MFREPQPKPVQTTLDYDPAEDSRRCYDVAIAELRKRHEAGK